jgi:[amino group carrier protein]-lysine/ornithine hydrolase
MLNETKYDRELAFSLGEKLLSIYSPSDEESEIAKFIEGELRQHGLSPRIDKAGNVICEIGSGSKSILLCPHIDTVPGFLAVKREGSKIFGRGASDAKGAVLSMILSFERIAEEMKRDEKKAQAGKVVLACVVGEEKQSSGLEELIASRLRTDSAIFGEPCGLNRIAIGYRGHVQASFEVTSKEAHSSAPHLTKSSIEISISLYGELKDKLTGKSGSSSNDAPSVAMTEIHAGVAHNVIPQTTTMTIDVRIPVGRSSDQIISVIKTLIEDYEKTFTGVKVKADFQEPTEPYKAKIDSSIVRALSRSILKSGHGSPAFVMKSGTGDMNTYALSLGVESVTYGPGDPKLSHTDSEFMDIDEVLICASILSNSAFEYFEIERKKENELKTI